MDENLGALSTGAERFFLNVWFETLTLGVDVVERRELGFDETFDVRAGEFLVHGFGFVGRVNFARAGGRRCLSPLVEITTRSVCSSSTPGATARLDYGLDWIESDAVRSWG